MSKPRTVHAAGLLMTVLVGLVVSACTSSGPSTSPTSTSPSATSPGSSVTEPPAAESSFPTATSSAEPTAADVIAQANLFDYWSPGFGTVLSWWDTCQKDPAGCTWAWQYVNGDHTTAEFGGEFGAKTKHPTTIGLSYVRDSLALSVFPGGIVLRGDGIGEIRFDDGTTRPLTQVQGEAIRPGDLLVFGASVLDPSTGHIWPVTAPRIARVLGWGFSASTVTADGTLWGTISGPAPRIVRLDARGWHFAPTKPTLGLQRAAGWAAVVGVPPGKPTHVAELFGTQGPVVVDPEVFCVSTDGGATFRYIPVSKLPFSKHFTLEATADGTLFVNDRNGLWRSTNDRWTKFTQVTGPVPYEGFQQAGNSIVGIVKGTEKTDPVLVFYADDGTYRTMPLR